jgi:hypothetical protein
MSIKDFNSKGFAAVEAVLIVVILAIISGTGFYIYNANKETGKTLESSTESSTKSKVETKKINPEDAVLFAGADYKLYSISLLALTADQKSMANVLDAQCKQTAEANQVLVASTGTADLFTGKDINNNFKKSGNFAVINMGCYDKSAGGEQGGGGALHYLRKVSNKWTFITASQSGVLCSDFDNTGVPSDILEKCYDELTDSYRAPKP